MTQANRELIIGTRGSHLALWQAHTVAAALNQPYKVEIIQTHGDRDQQSMLQSPASQTGFFTREIEHHLLNSQIDIAVHSLKDLPTQMTDGLELAAYLPRGPAADLLLIRPQWYDPDSNAALPLKNGCICGAGSLRRQSLIRHYCPDAIPQLIRGNVPTRIRKCLEGQYGAIVMAQAGIERIHPDLENLIAVQLEPSLWLPAPGQGVVAVQIRADDAQTRMKVSAINHVESAAAVKIERMLLAHFEGGCHTAFGAFARRNADHWIVDLGMDLAEKGWMTLTNQGQWMDFYQLNPTQFNRFVKPANQPERPICTKFQLSS